ICDNASTDNSVEIMRSFRDPRISLRVNRYNVGFARNLDHAGAMANGKYMIMLSSDDIMAPAALSTYAHLLQNLESSERDGAVITSPPDWIDGNGRLLGHGEVDLKFWSSAHSDDRLSTIVGPPVLVSDPIELLTRALSLLRNPLPFAPTCYPR